MAPKFLQWVKPVISKLLVFRYTGITVHSLPPLLWFGVISVSYVRQVVILTIYGLMQKKTFLKLLHLYRLNPLIEGILYVSSGLGPAVFCLYFGVPRRRRADIFTSEGWRVVGSAVGLTGGKVNCPSLSDHVRDRGGVLWGFCDMSSWLAS